MCQKTIHTHTFHDGFWATKRVERNIRLKDIAEFANISVGVAGSYMVGRTLPSEDRMRLICEFFGVDPSEGIPKFYEDHNQYVANRGGVVTSKSEMNPDADIEPAKVRTKKGKVIKNTTTKLKHHTPWRQRFIDTNTNYKEFAELIGKDKSSVSKYLAGKYRPDKETIQMFADYFNVPYSQAAEEFQIGYEQFWHIDHKKAIKLADIDDTSKVPLPEVEIVEPESEPGPKKAPKVTNKTLEKLYGKVDAVTFVDIVKKGKISEAKLRELYLNTDYDTFIELSKYVRK